MPSIKVPPLTATMQSATVVAWYKKVGDAVEVGEPVAAIETDKAVVDLPAPYRGVLRDIVAADGQSVRVGDVLARIEDPAGDVAASEPCTRFSFSSPPVSASDGTAEPFVRASPAARRRARELGVALATVVGSGPHGRVTTRDVEQAASSERPGDEHHDRSTDEWPTEWNAMRRQIAAAVTWSAREIPTFWAETPVVLDSVLNIRQLLNQGQPTVHLTLTDFWIQALVDTLTAYPAFLERLVQRDGRWQVDRVAPGTLGLAVAVPGGLVGVTMTDLHEATVGEIGRRRQSVVEAARHGRLEPKDLAPASLTLSNLGMVGVTRFRGLVQPDQLGLIAVGAVDTVTVWQDGQPRPGAVSVCTLAVDHRLIDGWLAGRFLGALKQRVEQGPWRLV